jgi:hypothetical protein
MPKDVVRHENQDNDSEAHARRPSGRLEREQNKRRTRNSIDGRQLVDVRNPVDDPVGRGCEVDQDRDAGGAQQPVGPARPFGMRAPAGRHENENQRKDRRHEQRRKCPGLHEHDEIAVEHTGGNHRRIRHQNVADSAARLARRAHAEQE